MLFIDADSARISGWRMAGGEEIPFLGGYWCGFGIISWIGEKERGGVEETLWLVEILHPPVYIDTEFIPYNPAWSKSSAACGVELLNLAAAVRRK